MIDFPATPTVGQTFTSGGQSWTWDGMKWVAYGVAQGIYLPLSGGKLTGALNPAGGIIGVTDGSSAAPGMVGEVISSAVLNPGVAVTSGVVKNVATLPLTAGDWDVQGAVGLAPSGNTLTSMVGGISTTSGANDPVDVGVSRSTINGTTAMFSSAILPLGPCRVSLSAPATYYLVANATFASGTCTAYGNIWARRAR